MIHSRTSRSKYSTPRTPAFDSGIISEPLLHFGGRKEHVDPKTGLSLFGPYSLVGQSKPNISSITVGIVGPGSMVSDAEQWLAACKGILSNDGKQPFLYPHFPGFNSEHPFQCELVYGDTWRETIKISDLNKALEPPLMSDKIQCIIKLYIAGIETLAQREPAPNVILFCLPEQIIEQCISKITSLNLIPRQKPKDEITCSDSKSLSKGSQQYLFPQLNVEEESDADSWEYGNLRRGLKAEAMVFGIPTQIIWPRAIEIKPTAGARGQQKAQDIATRAWNFTTALYHKAGGSPWRLAKLEPGVCFVGISFFKDLRGGNNRMRTSMAQAFTSAGDGYVLRGNPFEWNEDEHGRSPHLDQKSAAALLNDVIELYKKQSRGSLPNRIVVHKTSRFSNEELAGFSSATSLVPRKDFIALGWRDIQFYRTGMYPPTRGTYIKFSDTDLLLYTSGYIPYMRTYPGIRVPQPLEILEHHGDSPWTVILEEILAMTKMNWNTADFSTAKPITVAFSQRVGRILAELPPSIQPRPEYRFYM